MKTLYVLFVFVILLLLPMVGCEEDVIYQDLIPIGSEMGDDMVDGEDETDDARGAGSGYTLEECAEIALFQRDKANLAWKTENPHEMDVFIDVASDLYRAEENRTASTDEDDIIKRKKKLRNQLGDGAIMDEDVRRILPVFADHVSSAILDYVVDTLLFGGGTRIEDPNGMPTNEREWYIYNFLQAEIWGNDHPRYIEKYEDYIYYYFYYFAIDPANYAEAKKAGLPVPPLEEVMEQFPPEKIAEFVGKPTKDGKTDRQQFKEWTLTQVDYMQPDWKPVAVEATPAPK